MARVPVLSRLSREDFKEAPEWFGRFLDLLSPFVGDVSGALGSADSRQQFEPMTLTTAASLEATFASGRVAFKNRLGVAPRKVSLVRCLPATLPSFAQETWVAPTLLNSWVNFGSDYTPVGYSMEGGRVWLRGLIKSGTLNADAFVLPAAFRPAHNIVFGTAGGANSIGTGRIWAATSTAGTPGGVRPASAVDNSFFSLEGISFEPAAWTGISPAQPIWDMTSAGVIRIRYIGGLSPSTKYELTFEVE